MHMRTRARKRILDFVAQHPGATAAQMARGLGMTAPAVRHHLAILIADGRFELAAGAAEGRRGGQHSDSASQNDWRGTIWH